MGIAAWISNHSVGRSAAGVLYPTTDPHAAPPRYGHLRLAEPAPIVEPPSRSPADGRPIPKTEEAHAGLPAASRPVPRTEEAARQADALAVALRGAIDLATVPLAAAARGFIDKEGWLAFGHARLEDHARERFGRSGRWVRDLASLGRMFSTLPGLESAVCGADGGPPVGRVAGLLIGRVASPESVVTWIERARRLGVRELREEQASARAAGSPWPPGTLGVPASEASREGQEGGGTQAPPGCRESGAEDDDDDATRSLVRIEIPSPVLAAFDEAFDLFRAVEGREATVTAFVEALVAEAASSSPLPEPHGADAVSSSPLPESFDGAIGESLTRGRAAALRERALARSTNGWEHLSAGPQHGEAAPEWALHLAGLTLARLEVLAREAGRGAARAAGRLRRDLGRRARPLPPGRSDDSRAERLEVLRAWVHLSKEPGEPPHHLQREGRLRRRLESALDMPLPPPARRARRAREREGPRPARRHLEPRQARLRRMVQERDEDGRAKAGRQRTTGAVGGIVRGRAACR